jgi:hypothetical protein
MVCHVSIVPVWRTAHRSTTGAACAVSVCCVCALSACDACGIGGNGASCAQHNDCHGVLGGSAVYDVCDVCGKLTDLRLALVLMWS